MRANSSPVASASSSGKSGEMEALIGDVLDPGALAWLKAELVRCSTQ